ncbi:hypothetical protein EDD85DRAFT_939377 [Armillaria nabsnona]|nr:hypothetical protein EDD85DRAFT_939377 [Armillaria nabsnona]
MEVVTWTLPNEKPLVVGEGIALRNLEHHWIESIVISAQMYTIAHIKTATLSGFEVVFLGPHNGHTIFMQDVTGERVTIPCPWQQHFPRVAIVYIFSDNGTSTIYYQKIRATNESTNKSGRRINGSPFDPLLGRFQVVLSFAHLRWVPLVGGAVVLTWYEVGQVEIHTQLRGMLAFQTRSLSSRGGSLPYVKDGTSGLLVTRSRRETPAHTLRYADQRDVDKTRDQYRM